MTAEVVIGNGLRLCERCRDNRIGDYGWFNDRCCVARHTLTLIPELQTAKYERFEDRYSHAAAVELMADVAAMRIWQTENGIKP